MHLPTLKKLIALFISGSILISSVPVYAGETTSLTEPVTSEVIAEQDMAGEGLTETDTVDETVTDTVDETVTDMVDENLETPADPDAGSVTTADSDEAADSNEETADGVEANIEESSISQPVAGGRSISEAGGNGDSDTPDENDTDSGDSDTPGYSDMDMDPWPKRESFAHQFHNDANDPAYDELRKELDEIFRNAQLQDITDLPANYSLVSLPIGGEGSGGSTDRSAPIGADQGRNVLMPVYNQGDTMQTCWSFTGTGIIESYLIRNHYDELREQGIELSKWQVPAAGSLTVSSDTVIGGYYADPSQYGEGIGYTLGDGGTPTTYGQAVTSWAGLDYEKNVPTPRHRNDMNELTPAQIDQAVARGRDALFLPTPTPNMVGHDGYSKKTDLAEATVYDPGAVAAIKNCLMKIGPVYTEICYQENEPAEKGGINEYENWEYGSMYYPLWTIDTFPTHAVTIVGWDDHYSRDLFGQSTPPGDGAFLIKNSFGKMGEDSKAGDQSLFREGYFWLSYYDATIQTPATFTGTLVEDGKYDHLYMNDYTGFENAPYVEIKEGVFDSDRNDDGVIGKDEIVKCANVFKAKDNEMLKAVGALANRANSLAEYWIYLLKEGYSNPEDGELIYSALGENGIKAKYAGYNVQDLVTPIALVKDQLFSIVARVIGSEGGQLPLEVKSSMCDNNTKIAGGQTYYTDKNGDWTDVCDFKISQKLFVFKASGDEAENVGNATVRAMTSDANLSYKVTRGDGSAWKAEADSGLELSASGEHGKFSYLMIDGKLIDVSEYTTSGSKTDVSLSADLLKRLGEGEHTIMFVYNDGWASASFSVVGDHTDSEDKSNVDNSEPSLSKSSSPNTGDTTPDSMPVCALLMMLSLAGIVVVKRRTT